MRSRLARFAIPAILTLLAGTSAPIAQGIVHNDAAHQFLRTVDEYMALRQHLERQLPPFEVTDDIHRLDQAVHARAQLIRRARADARTGDIFNAAVGDLFRSRIEQAFAIPPCSVAALSWQMNEYAGQPARAVVNGRFAWRTAVATPAWVLAALPALPRALQYRFVGPDLALVDIDASVIVDVLTSVLDLSAVPPVPVPTVGDR